MAAYLETAWGIAFFDLGATVVLRGKAAKEHGSGLDRLRKKAWIRAKRLKGQAAGARAKPESLCPDDVFARSPLPGGRVDLSSLISGYTYSGFAIKPTLFFSHLPHD